MADIGLTNAVRELSAAIKVHMGAGAISGLAGGSSILNAQGTPIGGKNISEILSGLNDNIEKLTDITGKAVKSQTDNRDKLSEHLKGLESLGNALALAGPLVHQYAKYAISRPYEMLGGTMGQVGGRMQERERDAGQVATTAAAALALLLPGGRFISAAIVGLGAAGVNAVVGRAAFQKESIRGAGEETAARLATERVLGARDSMYLNYKLGRLDVAGKGMGGAGGNEAADILSAMGLSGDQSAEVLARVQAVGSRGYGKFSMGRARTITELGIYGQDIGANAESLQMGNRLGFSEAEFLSGSRRTGFQLPQVAQAAQQARQQTFMFGMGAGNQLFNAATNTTMGQVLGPGAAMGAITQTAGAMAQAGGDEAVSMLQYRQFLDANPGSTYLDFVEARTMKEASPKWRKMMAQAAGAYGGSQAMRIAGVGIGVFRGAGVEAVETSKTLLNQAAGIGGAGELTKEGAAAPGSTYFQKLGHSDLDQSRAAQGQIETEFGGTIANVTSGLSAIAKSAVTLSDATIASANLMKKHVVDTTDVISNTLQDWRAKMMGETPPERETHTGGATVRY